MITLYTFGPAFGLPDPSPFVVLWLYSHPPVDDRIRFANSYHPWSEGQPLRFVRLGPPYSHAWPIDWPGSSTCILLRHLTRSVLGTRMDSATPRGIKLQLASAA